MEHHVDPAALALLDATAMGGRGLDSLALVVVHPPSRTILHANEPYCRLLHRAPDDVIGRDLLTITYPDDVPITTAGLRQVGRESGASIRYEKRYIRPDGSTCWALVNALNCGDDRVLAHVTDIDELVGARTAAEAARRRLGALIENSADVIAVLDRDGCVRDANPASLRLVGANSPAQQGTQSLFELIHPEDAHGMLRKFANTVEHPGIQSESVFRIRAADGRWVHLSTIATNCLDDPAVGGIIINGRDVTAAVSNLRSLVAALVRATEYRDPYTAGHQSEVSKLAGRIARRMALYPDAVIHIELGGALHDLGKIAVPLEILTKPTRLTEPEMMIVRTHCQIGQDILSSANFADPITDIVLHHHERLDGSGYPHALAGDEVSLGARIVAVADVIDAMSAHRPYRPALGITAALHEITSQRGKRYDADVVDIAVELLRAPSRLAGDDPELALVPPEDLAENACEPAAVRG